MNGGEEENIQVIGLKAGRKETTRLKCRAVVNMVMNFLVP
jgi:hypothetical protein